MIYIVFYKHSFFNHKLISAVFFEEQKAVDYKKLRESDNECVYASWEIEAHEVTE